ncbi:MAG: hypothetical protein K2X69_01650, partial [Silvanigrellaceae bacterium]|nr:hypothetical protein [Silvanigrellaceae bacterium]
RFWISAALTPEVIQKGIKNLIPSEKMKWLKIAARGRDMIDWSIGMNGTRALTTKTGVFGHTISVGRVQTPTLAFIVEREMEIKKFASKAFYTIEANLFNNETSFKSVFEYFNNNIQKNTHQIFDKDFMEDIYNSVKDAHNAEIIDIKSENKKENPPHLFDLTTLQRESNKLFGLSAEDTLKATQNLYEKHKCLSYPRTDYAHLPPEMLNPLLKSLQDLKLTKILNENYFITAIENAEKLPRSVFDSTKVGDHHAIIPSGYNPKIEEMDINEKNIYLLVLKRVLAAFNYFHAYDKNTIIVSINENKFYSKGRTVTQKGWKEIYGDNEDDKIKTEEQFLPKVIIGDKLQIKNIIKKEDKTKPPKRMSEADLLGAMQNPTRGLQDETFIDILKEKGIGTPATRANIIKNLIEKHYIIREGRNLLPTEKGISLIQNLKPESLKSPEMTALWEQKLNLMEKGQYSPIKFVEDIKILINEIIKEAPEAAKLFKESIEKDPNFSGNKSFIKSENKNFNSKISNLKNCSKPKKFKNTK